MVNVPADYLIWLYENNKYDHDIGVYLRNNLEVLRKEVEKNED